MGSSWQNLNYCEDTKGVIRFRKSKKDRQHNDQTKKRRTDNTMTKRKREGQTTQ